MGGGGGGVYNFSLDFCKIIILIILCQSASAPNHLKAAKTLFLRNRSSSSSFRFRQLFWGKVCLCACSLNRKVRFHFRFCGSSSAVGSRRRGSNNYRRGIGVRVKGVAGRGAIVHRRRRNSSQKGNAVVPIKSWLSSNSPCFPGFEAQLLRNSCAILEHNWTIAKLLRNYCVTSRDPFYSDPNTPP